MKPKCTAKLIEQVRLLIEQGLSWPKIAEVTKTARQTLHNYRDSGSDSYNKDFAEMVQEAQEALTDKTKAGQFEQSVKHTLKKSYYEFLQVDLRSLSKKEKKTAKVHSLEKEEERTREKMAPPPEMPPTWLTKPYLIDYAEQVLDLSMTADTNLSIADIRSECLLRVKELTVTVKVKIESEQEVDPCQAAVKTVLTNMGNEKNRWSFKEEHEIDASDPLKNLLAEIGGIKKGLPDAGKIPEYRI